MPVIARISALWSKQKLFIALFFLAVSGWFYFDGAINWPRQNERWLAHKHLVDEGRAQEWPKYAADHGWVAQVPEHFHDVGNRIGQFVFGGLATMAGGFLLIYWATQRKRLLKMVDDAVFTPSGARVPFSAIRGIGKKRWDTKGIAVVRYEDNGRLLQFVVDDYKYETEPARQILDTIEQKLLNKLDHAA